MIKVNIHNKQRGFTILELMVVIAVAGILAAFALPNFDIMLKNNCMVSKTNSLISSLQFARSEAAKRNNPVSIVAFNPGNTGNEWGTGWNIVDNATATTIRSVQQECTATTADGAIWNSPPTAITDNAFSAITYTADGFMDSDSNGAISICDDRTGETGRRISFSTTGRPALSDFNDCS